MNADELKAWAFETWIGVVADAYTLAKTERLAELRGDARIRLLDSRMIHPFSELVGMARVCEQLFPELSMLELDPVAVRREAERDAQDQYGREWAVKHGYVA